LIHHLGDSQLTNLDTETTLPTHFSKEPKMFIEADVAGDPFEVSDADTMLEYINKDAKKPAAISIITKPGCPFCAKAKAHLKAKGLAFEEVVLGTDATSVSLKAISGKTTVPQVFVDGQHIGGSEELEAYLA